MHLRRGAPLRSAVHRWGPAAAGPARRLRLDALPHGYDTAAGLVFAPLGRLPERGDIVHFGDWSLGVAAIEGLGIKRLTARPAVEQAGR